MLTRWRSDFAAVVILHRIPIWIFQILNSFDNRYMWQIFIGFGNATAYDQGSSSLSIVFGYHYNMRAMFMMWVSRTPACPFLGTTCWFCRGSHFQLLRLIGRHRSRQACSTTTPKSIDASRTLWRGLARPNAEFYQCIKKLVRWELAIRWNNFLRKRYIFGYGTPSHTISLRDPRGQGNPERFLLSQSRNRPIMHIFETLAQARTNGKAIRKAY